MQWSFTLSSANFLSIALACCLLSACTSEAEVQDTGISGIKKVAFTPTPHGWPLQAVAAGNQLLLANGETFRGLQRIDWSDTEHPLLAQSFDTGNVNAAMVRLENRVYVLASYYGISIFDIGEEGELSSLGRWRMPPPADHGRRMVGLVRDGHHYLYLHIQAEGGWKDWPKQVDSPQPGLYLLDVSEPDDVTWQRIGNGPMFSAIDGDYGYVIQGKNLAVYALYHPEDPRRIGIYEATGRITGFSVDGGQAWLTVQGKALELVSLADPYKPELLARSTEGKMRQAASLAARDGWAYVMESGNGFSGPDRGLHVFHWHNHKLEHITHIIHPHSNMQRIVLADHAAYITDGFYGVWRLDISQAGNPEFGTLFQSTGENQQLLIQGNIGLLNMEWGGTVGIFDVSDPLHIRLQSYYRPGTFDDYAVGSAGHYFYYGKHGRRRIVDISDPANAVEIGQWQLPGQALMPPFHKDHYFFEWLGAKQQVLLIAYDMADPVLPKEIGRLALPDEVTARFGARASDGKRMFAISDNSILAIDISRPSAMHLLGNYKEAGIGKRARYTWQGAGRRAALNGDYLYIIQGSEAEDAPRITVMDVSDPAHMRRVFTTPLTKPAYQDDWFDERLLHQGDMLNDMVLHGGHLFVSDYWGGVRVYDCSTPYRPRLSQWEFQPYLDLLPEAWNRKRYRNAVDSGHLHKALGLDIDAWKERHHVGHELWPTPLAYHPGYELFAWNIGNFVGDYLLQPKLGGIAVYHFDSDSH